MSNGQFWGGIAVVMIGMALSYYDLRDRLGRIEGDLKQFYRDMGRHDEAIEAVKKRVGL
jgi:hypothetical protein